MKLIIMCIKSYLLTNYVENSTPCIRIYLPAFTQINLCHVLFKLIILLIIKESNINLHTLHRKIFNTNMTDISQNKLMYINSYFFRKIKTSSVAYLWLQHIKEWLSNCAGNADPRRRGLGQIGGSLINASWTNILINLNSINKLAFYINLDKLNS